MSAPICKVKFRLYIHVIMSICVFLWVSLFLYDSPRMHPKVCIYIWLRFLLPSLTCPNVNPKTLIPSQSLSWSWSFGTRVGSGFWEQVRGVECASLVTSTDSDSGVCESPGCKHFRRPYENSRHVSFSLSHWLLEILEHLNFGFFIIIIDILSSAKRKRKCVRTVRCSQDFLSCF